MFGVHQTSDWLMSVVFAVYSRTDSTQWRVVVCLADRMHRGWNLGHKPTDYTRWTHANQSYDVSSRSR